MKSLRFRGIAAAAIRWAGVSFDWVDAGRHEIYSGAADDRRELVVWVWYPASSGAAAERAVYLPQLGAPAGQMLGLDSAGLFSNAVVDALVSDEQSSYPVLVLSPSGFPPLLLSAIAEELASHGYVVVGVNHTYETAVTVFADGRVVPTNSSAVAGVLGPQTGPYQERFRHRAAVCDYKAADLASVADQLERRAAYTAGLLAGRLDPSRLGTFGHSFGGNAALQWCHDDPRCQAAANLDGALWTEVGRLGLARPVLQVLSEHKELASSGEEAVTAGIATDAAAYDTEKAITFGGRRMVHHTGRPSHTVQMEGATHVSFMDVPLLPLVGDSPVKDMLATARIEPRRMWQITCDLLLAFFATHLRQAAASPMLEKPSKDYPELVFGPP